jgi:hypothetical protein
VACTLKIGEIAKLLSLCAGSGDDLVLSKQEINVTDQFVADELNSSTASL